MSKQNLVTLSDAEASRILALAQSDEAGLCERAHVSQTTLHRALARLPVRAGTAALLAAVDEGEDA